MTSWKNWKQFPGNTFLSLGVPLKSILQRISDLESASQTSLPQDHQTKPAWSLSISPRPRATKQVAAPSKNWFKEPRGFLLMLHHSFFLSQF